MRQSLVTLREDQIQRYGRQILLREVGGAGQRTLIASPVGVDVSGPAAEVAITYLAAGGSPLIHPPFTGVGFLTGATPAALNPDVATNAGAVIALTAVPVAGPCVVLGRQLAFFPDGSCEACTRTPELAGTPHDPVIFGSAAALLVQRFVLGFATAPVLLGWKEASLAELQGPPCPRHRSD